MDIRQAVESAHDILNETAQNLNGESIEKPGELIIRTIDTIINELGDRFNFAAFDTTNGTEYVLGEFTLGLYSQISFFADLYKSEVYMLGEFMGIPSQVLSQEPRNTALSHTTKLDLYFGIFRHGISPRHAFEALDPILYWLYDKEKCPEFVSKKLGHSLSFVKNVNRRIKNQKYRRDNPVFCIKDHSESFPRRTPLSNRRVVRIVDKEMLADFKPAPR